jgi:zinc D-Ala-D-Ala dipeptidase
MAVQATPPANGKPNRKPERNPVKNLMFHLRSLRKFIRSVASIFTTCACLTLVFSCTAFAKGKTDPIEGDPDSGSVADEICELEQRIVLEGLVDVCALDPSIMVDIAFARPDNFIGENVYGDFAKAYLRPEAAWKLVQASEILQERYPHLRILVVDALRPRSVQHMMWKIVAGTPMQPYVANPYSGSMHNYGAAVDVTLYDTQSGEPLDMGTPYHFFGTLAQPILEKKYLRKGKLSEDQVRNRLILRNAMSEAGWLALNIEWWHFDAFPREHVRKRYTIVE